LRQAAGQHPGAHRSAPEWFRVAGYFEADLHSKIDLANLDALDLGGKVGIDGCQVVKAPAEVTALARSEGLIQTVEVPPEPPGNGNPGLMTFIVGPDSPDFVPLPRSLPISSTPS